MSSSTHFICRLCLQKFTESSKTIYQDSKLCDMLKYLFPAMNIDLVKTSKICNDCFKSVQFSYNMRQVIVKNEQKIKTNISCIQKVQDSIICRLCLNNSSIESPIFLYDNGKQTISILEAINIIETSLITLNFGIFKKPVVCTNCWQIIRSIFLFKKRCLATEKILSFYSTKNSLKSLSDAQMESISHCYNSNLQKYSQLEKTIGNCFFQKETLRFTPKVFFNSIDNIIKPVDVYLNNFTSGPDDDDDDLFIEEQDDVFEEYFEGTLKNVEQSLVSQKCENLKVLEEKMKMQNEKSLNPNTTQEFPENIQSHFIKIEQENSLSNIAKDVIEDTPMKNMEVFKPKPKTKKSKSITSSPPQVKQSLRTKTPTLHYCNTCDFSTKYKQHLFRHNHIHATNAETLNCDKCVYSTKIKRNFLRHMLVHSSENLLSCVKCLYSTTYKSSLVNHMKTHKQSEALEEEKCEIDYRKFWCGECPYVTSREKHMVAHIQAHQSKKTVYKCPHCYYISMRGHTLKHHLELHRNLKPSKNTHKCNVCSFTGKRKTDLCSHMLTHEGAYLFQCGQCDYKAKRKAHLVSHMLCHRGLDEIQLFACSFCMFRTKRRDHLGLHVQAMHLNKKPKKLDEDKKYFICSDTRENTITTCPICLNKIKGSSMIKHTYAAHYLYSSRTGSFECNDCSYKTSARCGLVAHLKRNLHQKIQCRSQES